LYLYGSLPTVVCSVGGLMSYFVFCSVGGLMSYCVVCSVGGLVVLCFLCCVLLVRVFSSSCL
jgi:hypothetical protein